MIPQFSNLLELQKYFNNELVCAKYLEQKKWNGKPVCPDCGCEKIYRFKTRLRHPELKNYKDFICSNKECKKIFSVLTDSIFEGSKISLQVWFSAMYLISAHKKGISSHQLASDLGITQKSSWFILHRIRCSYEPKPIEEKIDGLFQADETFIGGKNKNRHAHKKVDASQGRSTKDKTPVFGLQQTGGDIHTFVVKNTKAETLQPIIKSMIKSGAIIVTDEWNGYNGLSKDYGHILVNHNEKQYVNGAFSNNAIEGYWSLFKRGIFGIYHWVSAKHLHRYCNEFSYRYNRRKISDINKFELALLQSNNKRLTYNQLIAKPVVDLTEDVDYDVVQD